MPEQNAPRPIEDLTLSELAAQFAGAPKHTWRQLQRAHRDQSAPVTIAVAPAAPGVASRTIASPRLPEPFSIQALRSALGRPEAIQVLICSAAILCALAGSLAIRGGGGDTQASQTAMAGGGALLWLGFGLWLSADILERWANLKTRWQDCDRRGRLLWLLRLALGLVAVGALYAFAQSMTAPAEVAVDRALAALGTFLAAGLLWLPLEFAVGRSRLRKADASGERNVVSLGPARRMPWHGVSRFRMGVLALAALSSIIVWERAAGNRIEPPVLLLWLASIALWGVALLPARWNCFERASAWIDMCRRVSWRERRWQLAAFALVMLLGAHFRLERLDEVLPELYSDLVINIIDAYRVHTGADQRVFLANNGGREPMHVYLYALLGSQPGLGFSRYSLNLLAALESILTLPIMVWLGVVVMGGRRPKEAWRYGLLAGALVAVSFWHVALGRQGLRVALSPLFTTLSAVFFVRALRGNGRADFLLAGITLAFGLSSYKAIRALPLVYVACVGIALILRRHSWRRRASVALNLAALAFIACMAFLPMLRFWHEDPDMFTLRMTTRMYGDSALNEADRSLRFREDGATLLSNLRNALLMFHSSYDRALVSSAPDEPALDPVSSAFFTLGLAAWLSLLLRKRDPVFWFAPLLLAVMVGIAALAIAYPIEAPSYQRSSAAIPAAYLIAALPMALYSRKLRRALPRRAGTGAVLVFIGAALLAAYQYNHQLYFGPYARHFADYAQPHSVAGRVLRGFANSDGAYGNAFVINSAHWWDNRAVGIEAGAMLWDSGGDIRAVPSMLRGGLLRAEQYRLDPERDLLFFYSSQNSEAAARLQALLPQGRAQEFPQENPYRTFFAYRVPALGEAGLNAWLARHE